MAGAIIFGSLAAPIRHPAADTAAQRSEGQWHHAQLIHTEAQQSSVVAARFAICVRESREGGGEGDAAACLPACLLTRPP